MAVAYHMEARRKERVYERAREATRRLQCSVDEQKHEETLENLGSLQKKDKVLCTDAGQFEQIRSSHGSRHGRSGEISEEGVVLGEVVHDPNFKYRILKDSGCPPLHVDPIYKIMYPGAFRYQNQAGLQKHFRPPLQKFRVNEDGFRNRYRNRQQLSPHCDEIFSIVYPGSDNTDYTSDKNKTRRRLNQMSDRYDILCKVNGDFHVKVLIETEESIK